MLFQYQIVGVKPGGFFGGRGGGGGRHAYRSCYVFLECGIPQSLYRSHKSKVQVKQPSNYSFPVLDHEQSIFEKHLYVINLVKALI